MTDNKTIKALELAIHRYKDTTHHVSCIVDINILKKAINLINRQKAEIERLEKEIKDKERAYNDELCSRKEWQTKCRELLKEKQITTSEAIKEFAEKLKKRFYLSAGRCVVDVYHIDNLVKEMTEVNENDRA